MKFYRPLFQPLLDALEVVFTETKPATQVIEAVFKSHKKWGSQDRRLFAETFYDIIKHRIFLEKALEKDLGCVEEDDFPQMAKDKMAKDKMLKDGSLVIFYLLIQGHKIIIPELLQSLLYKKIQEQVNSCKKPSLKNLIQDSPFPLEVKNSIPHKLHQICQEEVLSVSLQKYYTEIQKKAHLFLRVNSFKSTVQNLAVTLEKEEFSVEKVGDWGLKVLKNPRVFKTQSFKNGEFEVQDGGSQCIAPFLDPQPGDFVVDACAGAGGKSLHLSNLMKNKGRIVALDIYQWKLDELHRRAKRNGSHNIETRLITSSKVIKRLHSKANYLLLDVPCTGSGVFRRNPDAKYRWDQASFKNIQDIQRQILQSYAPLLKSKGVMVYSTCSVFDSENQKQVHRFLDENSGWTLDKEVSINVGDDGFDGYYMARLFKT